MGSSYSFHTTRNIDTEEVDFHPDILRVVLNKNGDLEDDFFMRKADFETLEGHDGVGYLFSDLFQSAWRSEIDPRTEKGRVIKTRRKRRFRPVTESLIEYYRTENMDLSQFEGDSCLDMEDPDPAELGFWDGSCWLLYILKDWDIPLSPAYHFTHNEAGVTQGDFDLDKAEEILTNNKHVSYCERATQPHYNSGGKGLDYRICPDQAEFERLVRHWRDEEEDKHWTVSVKSEYQSSGALYDHHHDVLNLSEALKE